MFPVEVKITGDHRLTPSTIDNIRTVLSDQLMVRKEIVRFATAAKGCIVIVFLLPEHVKGSLRFAATNKAKWLTDANVSGVHIKGDEFISVVDVDKGRLVYSQTRIILIF